MPTPVDLPAWNGGSEKDHTESRLKSSAWMFYRIADIRFQVQLTQSASMQPQCRRATAAGGPSTALNRFEHVNSCLISIHTMSSDFRSMLPRTS